MFSRMIQTFHPDQSATPDALASVLNTLSEGPSDRGGQDDAALGRFRVNFAAMKEVDPKKKKAELILLANPDRSG